MEHLRFSNLPYADQVVALIQIMRADPLVWRALQDARDLDLPDWAIVSGAIYNSVWNYLTGKPPGYGIKDIDLLYFDREDLSYEAEDRVIQRASGHFSSLSLPVEVRNQARVHLWFPDRFGESCPQYESVTHSIAHFASKTHAVGVRLDHDSNLDIIAPFGLNDIFSFRIVPNHILNNQLTHNAKGTRAKALWAEIVIEAW
jgi:uncharacterized protein